jgi:hypothetical protein
MLTKIERLDAVAKKPLREVSFYQQSEAECPEVSPDSLRPWKIEHSLRGALNMSFNEDRSRARRTMAGEPRLAMATAAGIGVENQEEQRHFRSKRLRVGWSYHLMMTKVLLDFSLN